MLQRETHGVGMGHITSDRIEEGRLQRLRPVLVEQAQQRGGDAAQVVATLRGHLQQLGAGGDDLGECVAAAVRAGMALVCDRACKWVGSSIT